MENQLDNFSAFLGETLPMVELNDYISMHPDKNIKHRLRKLRQLAIESVNKRKITA
ncbi:MAG: hypothetical protein RRA94_06820 [Bacteroidota bacterium]|nr:hypothetical protein [Bacteroidota bacterium]